MHCFECGFLFQTKIKYCPSCGTNLQTPPPKLEEKVEEDQPKDNDNIVEKIVIRHVEKKKVSEKQAAHLEKARLARAEKTKAKKLENKVVQPTVKSESQRPSEPEDYFNIF
jgi:hypothetical protein